MLGQKQPPILQTPLVRHLLNRPQSAGSQRHLALLLLLPLPLPISVLCNPPCAQRLRILYLLQDPQVPRRYVCAAFGILVEEGGLAPVAVDIADDAPEGGRELQEFGRGVVFVRLGEGVRPGDLPAVCDEVEEGVGQVDVGLPAHAFADAGPEGLVRRVFGNGLGDGYQNTKSMRSAWAMNFWEGL